VVQESHYINENVAVKSAEVMLFLINLFYIKEKIRSYRHLKSMAQYLGYQGIESDMVSIEIIERFPSYQSMHCKE
jgi:hypothetical protein